MYIGNDLQVAYPNYKIIDDISGDFNGSETDFALKVGGISPVPFPINAQQLLISVNGNIMEPDPTGTTGFKLLNNEIVFQTAPTGGHAFFGVILAGADYVTVGTDFPDGSATAPSYTFSSQTNTGFYRNGSGDVGYTSLGDNIFNCTNGGLQIAAGKFLKVDTDTLVVDPSNNRVGIGTNIPGQLLELKSDTATTLFKRSSATSSNNDPYGKILWNSSSNNTVASIEVLRQSADDDSYITFNTRPTTGTNTERFRLDSSGRLLINHTSSVVVSTTSNAALQVIGSDISTTSCTISRFSADGLGPHFNFAKSRNGTKGTHTIVNNTDILGTIGFYGSDGADFNYLSTSIYSKVNGTPATNSVPADLHLSTTKGIDFHTGSTPTVRVSITDAGTLTLKPDGTNETYTFHSTGGLGLGTSLDYGATTDSLRSGGASNAVATWAPHNRLILRDLGSGTDGTLVAADAGKYIYIHSSATFTLVASIMTEGDIVYLVSDSSSANVNLTIPSGMSLIDCDNSGTKYEGPVTKTVSAYGLIKLVFHTANLIYADVSGSLT